MKKTIDTEALAAKMGHIDRRMMYGKEYAQMLRNKNLTTWYAPMLAVLAIMHAEEAPALGTSIGQMAEAFDNAMVEFDAALYYWQQGDFDSIPEPCQDMEQVLDGVDRKRAALLYDLMSTAGVVLDFTSTPNGWSDSEEARKLFMVKQYMNDRWWDCNSSHSMAKEFKKDVTEMWQNARANQDAQD